MSAEISQCRPEHVDLLIEITNILVLRSGFDSDAVADWFIEPHPLLDDRPPIDVVNDGHGYTVRNVAYLVA